MNEIKSNIQDKDSLTGKVFGGCRLIKKIGEGGMGAVYLAHHLALNKNVAVKILPPSFAQEEERVKRFIREARSAAQLEHSNIVQIYNIARHEDFYFIIMQYVDGESLAGKIKREGKINLLEALKIVKDVSSALSIAHQKGIVHRDIKPENIMINSNGEIKLMDFGLARVLDVASHLSRTGDILGTPYYLSPEQAQGQKVDGRADIYALGVTLYYMISGRRPFDGDSTVSIILKHINEKPTPIRNFNPEIPESVSRIINKMLEKDAVNRYQSTEELINDINICSNEIATGITSTQTVISSGHNVKPTPSGASIKEVVPLGTKKIINRKMIITAAILAIVVIIIISGIKKNKQPNTSRTKSNLADNGQVSPEQKREHLKNKLLKRCNECYQFLVDKNYEQIRTYIHISKSKQIPEEKVRLLVAEYLRKIHQLYEVFGNRLNDIKIVDIKIKEPSIEIPFINADVEINISFYNIKQPSKSKDDYKIIPQIHRWVLEDGIWYWHINPQKPEDKKGSEYGHKDK
ncbi:MAG: serine/threonine-protein kinase [Planctomycetota bacterium]